MTMRSSILSRELSKQRGLLRGKKVSTKRSESPSPVKPKTTFLESSELDNSFRTNAYPSTAEIFRLSQELELSPATIKAEFQKRRQSVRERNKLSDDTIIYSSTLPHLFLLLHMLCSRFNCTQQTLLQIAVFIFSVFSVWYSVYIKIRHDNYNQELVFLG
ncbi:uncharacterized protein LOC129228217 [Uloborus diversus]|uniref:uncharacterized protein LOC129228217 n=1 Tax=Uloborus diversus TaxID=327109 RepID=UPI0024094D7A|nr:uncharacterized protein LOC129228217 [Uloborus diversus]